MLTSEFAHRKSAISKYFINQYKWKYDEEGNLTYYKNPKKCLDELKFIIDIIFQDDFSLIANLPIRSFSDKIIGYSVIGEVDVCGNFNGMYQGEGRSIVYVKFNLCHKGFWSNESSSYENLIKED